MNPDTSWRDKEMVLQPHTSRASVYKPFTHSADFRRVPDVRTKSHLTNKAV